MSRGDLAVVVLAAGEGTRLRPLTDLLPKALCPVNGTPLLDLALGRAALALHRDVSPARFAVNAHHLAAKIVAHVDGRAHLSVESPDALGTAGALGRLRAWLDGRDALVLNADAWFADVPGGALAPLLDRWDGTRPRLLVVPDRQRADFRSCWRFAGASLMPAADLAGLPEQPAGLYEVCWQEADRAGRLELVPTTARFVDCGTPSDYLRANLLASGGASVIGEGAVVEGEVVRSVVWPGAVVAHGERLVEVVRAGRDLTVPAPQG